MEFQELINERRSIRKYEEGYVIPRETMVEILKDASLAPTWKNSQTGRCYVVEGETMCRFREKVLPSFNQNSSANASALIVTTFVKNVSGHTKGEADNDGGNCWGAYDLGLHDAYLILSAKDHGYDTLIMGIRNADTIREMLHIPEEEQILSVIAIGKRDQEPVLKPRKTVGETVKFF